MNRISELLQYMVIVIILLCLVFMVVTAYKSANLYRMENDAQRKENSYMFNKIRSYDYKDGVKIEKGKYGDMIVLSDYTDEGIFETRIYSHKGSIYEEYRAKTEALNYFDAVEISKSERFEATKKDDIIKVITDSGEMIVALRAEE